jgi:hypothetical protein
MLSRYYLNYPRPLLSPSSLPNVVAFNYPHTCILNSSFARDVIAAMMISFVYGTNMAAMSLSSNSLGNDCKARITSPCQSLITIPFYFIAILLSLSQSVITMSTCAYHLNYTQSLSFFIYYHSLCEYPHPL